jgi:hypothetical protein
MKNRQLMLRFIDPDAIGVEISPVQGWMKWLVVSFRSVLFHRYGTIHRLI